MSGDIYRAEFYVTFRTEPFVTYRMNDGDVGVLLGDIEEWLDGNDPAFRWYSSDANGPGVTDFIVTRNAFVACVVIKADASTGAPT